MVIPAFGAIVFFKLVAQTACFHANNRINSRIEGFAPVKYFESDRVFLEPMGLPEQALFDDELQETADSMRLYKDATAKNLIQSRTNFWCSDAI